MRRIRIGLQNHQRKQQSHPSSCALSSGKRSERVGRPSKGSPRFPIPNQKQNGEETLEQSGEQALSLRAP